MAEKQGKGSVEGLNRLATLLPTATGVKCAVVRQTKGSVRSILVLLCLMRIFSGPISLAATFTVNSGHDVQDLEPGNGLCVAYIVFSFPAVLPFCTLRAAIEEANSLPGEDVIYLEGGTYTLSLAGTAEDRAATGDLDISDSLRIIGAGADRTFIDAFGLDRVFDVVGSATKVHISGVTVRGGRLRADLPHGERDGGGVRNRGSLTLSRVVVAGNAAGDFGGGIYNDSNGQLAIQASTITANSAAGGGGLFNNGSATLTNVTVSGNRATVLSGGGLDNNGRLRLVHCTVAANSASAGGGVAGSGRLAMVNTLLAGNGGGNCFLAAGIESGGGNLDSGSTCTLTGGGDLEEADPRLGPLANNGGPTWTHALEAGSAAIDHGRTLAYITSDQRGTARPTRQGYDIGAYEAAELSLPPCFAPLLLH
ncbi:MAG TPA: hypothetical protein ENI89_02250 [Desulfobulbus sp.]|nr:hypothetical protein [Desulfobulbus sp.]